MLFRRQYQPTLSPTTDPISRKHSRGLKLFVWGLVLLILGSVSWVAVSGTIAFKNISAKNSGNQPSFFRYNGDISPDQLLVEGDSRINILSLGVDAAAGLTDSIQVISIDPVNKTLAILSIPRDLYVFNPTENRQTKINEIYNSAIDRCAAKKLVCDANVDAGGEMMKGVVANLLGVPVSYFTKVDFDGVKKIVDAVGGIQVYVDKPIVDPFYPSGDGYQTFKISAGLQQMNGDTALKYSRSRETTSDFDRARRQQQVIGAIKQKAFSLNILTNPKKVSDIITVVGHHFKTDLQTNEIASVLKLLTEIDSNQTTTKVLDNGPDGPLKSSVNSVGQFILIPKAGENDWTDVQEIAEATMPEPYLIKESATIQIVNATGRKTAGTDLKKKLSALGYKVVSVSEATMTMNLSSIVYSTDKPYTLALLKHRFKITPTKAKVATSGSDIIFSLGSNLTVK